MAASTVNLKSIRNELTLAAAGLVLLAIAKRRRKKRKLFKRQPTVPHVLNRQMFGAFHSLVQGLSEDDPKQARKYLLMKAETFDLLLHQVGPRIERQDTTYKDSIPPEERLAVTLRYLTEGGTYGNMFDLFRIPVSTLAYLIPNVCEVIYNVLKEQYLEQPKCKEEWTAIQVRFFSQYDFPHCLGALDGRHVRIQCPPHAGSTYYNYLGYHSILVFALVDANCRFIYSEVGAPGKVGGAATWNNSSLKAALGKDRLPEQESLMIPGSSISIPNLIVAEPAFPLSPQLMKPYSEKNCSRAQKVFNYRLSRVRLVSENAFGTLSSRFGIYQKAMHVHPSRVTSMVLATMALHNFLLAMRDEQYVGPGFLDAEDENTHEIIPGEWRNSSNSHLDGLQPVVGGIPGNKTEIAKGQEVRNALRDYFVGQGAVPWQDRAV